MVHCIKFGFVNKKDEVIVPWLRNETKKLMKERDELKSKTVKIVQEGGDATEAWSEFKNIRNKVNNRRKFEEEDFKAKKLE